MYLTGSPRLLRLFMPPGLIWQMPAHHKNLYLTFDDGPVKGVTEEALAVLKDYNAKATFFCVGDNVRKYPDTYRKIKEAGHVAGNHTFHHLNGWKTPDEKYFNDIQLCARWVTSPLFRPPYGRITRSQSRYLLKNFKLVMWTVLGGEFDHRVSAAKCCENIFRSATAGSIIVLHDQQKTANTMLQALPVILKHYADEDYNFLPLQFPV